MVFREKDLPREFELDKKEKNKIVREIAAFLKANKKKCEKDYIEMEKDKGLVGYSIKMAQDNLEWAIMTERNFLNGSEFWDGRVMGMVRDFFINLKKSEDKNMNKNESEERETIRKAQTNREQFLEQMIRRRIILYPGEIAKILSKEEEKENPEK